LLGRSRMLKGNEQNAKNENARPFHTAAYCLSREHARWNLPILDFRFWILDCSVI
jgi:hypothetical protein